MSSPIPPTLPNGDAPARSSVLRRLLTVLAVVALIGGFAALRMYLSEHRAIPQNVFADAIAERFAADPTLVHVLCTQPVLLLRRVHAESITSTGSQRRGTGAALAWAEAMGPDGSALPSSACRARIRFEYFSDTLDPAGNDGTHTIVVQVHHITRADSRP